MARPHLQTLRVLPSHLTATGEEDQATVAVYRPFFAMGILTVMTAGCLLGAIALYGISRAGSYTLPAWTPHIWAHANSQLFGWVGFFVMGFTLQQHAPRLARVRAFHLLAWSSLGLMAAGIALRFAAEPLARTDPGLGVPLGVAACLAQAAAVLLFTLNTAVTRHRTGHPMEWPVAFVFTSLFWLIAVTVAEPFVFLGSHQSDPTRSIQFVAEWFPVVREAQFLGFVAMMIFGVSLLKFPACFGGLPVLKKLGLMGLGWWSVGLVCRMAGWAWAFRHGFAGSSQGLHYFGGFALAVGAVHLAIATRVFAPFEGSVRSHKFLRAAYGWLIAAGVLMVLEPLHLAVLGQPFSHAYTGAIRHAVTVGFISQMIVGVSSHVVARMNGIADSAGPLLWPTFWLLNVGNAGRVALEISTDYSGGAFLPMGVTGFVELAGLALWAAWMARTMFPRLGRQLAVGS